MESGEWNGYSCGGSELHVDIPAASECQHWTNIPLFGQRS